MKKILLTILATLFIVSGIFAVPANHKQTKKVEQPDGSTITIRSFGDEFHHWTETADGYVVVAGQDGYLYYDAPNSPAKVRAHDPAQRSAADHSILSMTRRNGNPSVTGGMTWAKGMSISKTDNNNNTARMAGQKAPIGNYRSLVVLVNFSDKAFTVSNANAEFTNLLNQDGYSTNGATGSAAEYFYDNSNGKFDAQFDVVGPITLPRTSAYYASGSNDASLNFLKDIIAAANSSVDWSLYAENNTVRPIFVFFAGYNQAENSNDPSLIWPHSIDFTGYTSITTPTGQKLNAYACASEFSGYKGSNRMAAIGTFCHEFGHVIGLPDAYDTDYGENGSSQTPDAFSLMDNGSYNNNSRTPPAIMAMEREILGWLDEVEVLATSGNYTLPHIAENKAYKILTGTNNEYFWVETRGSNNRWDRSISGGTWGGLFVTHIDRTSSYIGRWNRNDLNAYSNHPCFLPVRANNTGGSTTASGGASSAWLFPGSSNRTALSSSTHALFKAWNGTEVDGEFSNISYSNGTSSFTFSFGEPTGISINPQQASVGVGGKLQLFAAVLPSNASYTGLEWSSSDNSVATIDAEGFVTGVSVGQVTINVKIVDTDLEATGVVNVIGGIGEVDLTSVLQNDAILSWDYAGEAFEIELKVGNAIVNTFNVSDKFIYLPLLSANSDYNATIYPLDNEGRKITGAEQSQDFKTLENSTEFAAMGLMKGTFAATDEIPLRAINLPANVESVAWSVDEESVEAPAVTLAAGKHKLTLTITTRDGDVETITRYVNVE